MTSYLIPIWQHNTGGLSIYQWMSSGHEGILVHVSLYLVEGCIHFRIWSKFNFPTCGISLHILNFCFFFNGICSLFTYMTYCLDNKLQWKLNLWNHQRNNSFNILVRDKTPYRYSYCNRSMLYSWYLWLYLSLLKAFFSASQCKGFCIF